MPKIPLFYPYISPRVYPAVKKVLKTKFIGQGPRIQEFEKAFGKKIGAKYCVSVNSGTASLHLAYILAGIKPGDEVIGPVLTCSATYHPILQMGGKLVFADIKKDTLCIDSDDIEHRITKKTKAIIPVHFGGYPADMEKIMKIAKKYNLKIIEDSAQHIGKKIYPRGDYQCYSFQAIKHITTCDGGMLVVNNKKDYEKAKRLRWFGIDRDLKIKKDWQPFKDWERREMTYDVDEIGYKYHITDVDAAIGIEQLKDLDKVLKRREKLVKLYRKLLKNKKGVKLLKFHPREAYWLFQVLLKNRNKVAENLKKAGVETNIVHVRCDIYKVFGGKRLNLPNMKDIEDEYLCLPLHPKLTEKDVSYIAKNIK
ncbi:MAG: DegT/DnrJ/EryC1/StrS family aminotransferase [Candidatus Nealsonbacteria bacterium]